MLWKSKIPYALWELYYSLDKIINTDTAKQTTRLEPVQEIIEIYDMCYDISEHILNKKIEQLQ